MQQIFTKVGQILNKIPGRGYLLLAIIIFAAANSVLRKLNDLGAEHLIDGRNPISFCNVLSVGNICALFVLTLLYGKQWSFQRLKQLSIADWLGLFGVAILSGALAPALTFRALELTMVNNVVLIGRIEPPLILTLSVLLLREPVNRWVVAGAMFSFVGVVLTILLPSNATSGDNMGVGLTIGQGELMAAGGAIALAISTIISKVKLRQIPLGIFTIFRTSMGVFIFSAIVLKLFGPSHFMDVFSPFLWQWMLFYGALILVGGQLCWFMGLKSAGAPDVSLASSFSPIAGILAAYFILGDAPTMAQYIGGSLIIVGIVLNQIGAVRLAAKTVSVPVSDSAKEMDLEVGFKGV